MSHHVSFVCSFSPHFCCLLIQPMLSIAENLTHSFGLNTIDWDLSPLRSITFAHEHIVKHMRAKVHVFFGPSVEVRF